ALRHFPQGALEDVAELVRPNARKVGMRPFTELVHAARRGHDKASRDQLLHDRDELAGTEERRELEGGALAVHEDEATPMLLRQDARARLEHLGARIRLREDDALVHSLQPGGRPPMSACPTRFTNSFA